MRKIYFVSIAALAIPAFLIFAGQRAFADSLPAATFDASMSYGTSVTAPGTATTSYCAPVSGGGDSCLDGNTTVGYEGGAPSFSGHETSGASVQSGFNASTGGGQGYVDFWFMVSGSNQVRVPLVLDASGAVAASAYQGTVTGQYGWSGSSDVGIEDLTTGAMLIQACAAAGDADCAASEANSFSGQFPFTVPSNTLEEIRVGGGGSIGYAGAPGFNYGYPSASWSFSVGPMISFAPGFDSTGLSLEFSPNPPTATPEPASLLLFGAGLVRAGLDAAARPCIYTLLTFAMASGTDVSLWWCGLTRAHHRKRRREGQHRAQPTSKKPSPSIFASSSSSWRLRGAANHDCVGAGVVSR